MALKLKELSLRAAREQTGLSLRKAAEQLGVTHAFLSALELGRKPLNKRRREELADIYGLSDPDVLVQPFAQDSRQFVDWQCEQIKWWDSRFSFPTLPSLTSLVSDLFVEQGFVTNQGALEQDELLQRFFKDSGNRALLLAGKVGTGKSFFLRMLTLSLDQILQRIKVKKDYLPVLVSCGDFELRRASFVRSLVDYYLGSGFEGSQIQLERLLNDSLQAGTAVFLFDGLDEIYDHQKRIETLAYLHHCFEDQIRPSGSKMIVTGREAAFIERDYRYQGFELVQISDWNPIQMHQGALRWGWESSQQAATFWALLQANDILFDLARLPLLFHLLATLYSTGGARAFQELTSLCEACCQVLEESWYTARRVMPSRQDRSQQLNEFSLPSWLKWHNFLIALMEQSLDEYLKEGRPPRLSFSISELQESWESFLTDRGIERSSLDFSRLVGLISDRSNIGPLVLTRRIVKRNGSTIVKEEFQFLAAVFAHYYLSKALINNPQGLSDFVLSNLRNKTWEKVIPLFLQELGRSERRFENQLGLQLINKTLCSDDSLQLEQVHKIGHFGLFTAMRGITTYNVNQYWETVIEPTLNIYMNSNYRHDVSTAFRIIGECSAIERVRRYFSEEHDQLLAADTAQTEVGDRKWRVLCAMARLGENVDFVLSEVQKGILELSDPTLWLDTNKRMHTRRLFWGLEQVGRLLTEQEEGSSSVGSLESQGVRDIQAALRDFVVFVQETLTAGMKIRSFKNYFFWDVLAVLLHSQARLRYRRDLEIAINGLCRNINESFKVFFNGYPWRIQLLQFLKAAARHSYLIERRLADTLIRKLKKAKANMPDSEAQEAAVVLKLLDSRELTGTRDFDQNEMFEEIIGPCDDRKIEGWLDTIRRHRNNAAEDYLDFVNALCGIKRSYGNLECKKKKNAPEQVIKTLLKALKDELVLEDRLREQERYYVLPFSSDGQPVYDHIYSCIVELARAEKLQNKNSNDRQM